MICLRWLTAFAPTPYGVFGDHTFRLCGKYAKAHSWQRVFPTLAVAEFSLFDAKILSVKSLGATYNPSAIVTADKRDTEPNLFYPRSLFLLFISNEHIEKVNACDEKLFFSLNIGNGLFAVANGIIRTLAISKRRLSAGAVFCFLFHGRKRKSAGGRSPRAEILIKYYHKILNM